MKNKFTGPLAEPIYREDWDDRSWLEFSEGARTEVAGDMAKRERWDAASRAQIAAEERRIAAVKAEKLALLASQVEALDARGEPDWRVLAQRLAEDVVPGLRVLDKTPFDPKPGRPKGKKALLVRIVEQLRRNEGLSIFAACCELSKRPGPLAQGEAALAGATIPRRYARMERTAAAFRRGSGPHKGG